MKKLLIVDDSKVSRMVIRAHVKAVQPDWEFIEAASGEEAIKMVEQHAPDFCTMDINMPGMLGTDAAEQILQAHPTCVSPFSRQTCKTPCKHGRMHSALFL
jgi:CheY-like chemotaxis protein